MNEDILIAKEMLLVWNVKKCAGTKHSKNGFIKGHQRYKCKNCGYQFVPTLQKGFDKQN